MLDIESIPLAEVFLFSSRNQNFGSYEVFTFKARKFANLLFYPELLCDIVTGVFRLKREGTFRLNIKLL